ARAVVPHALDLGVNFVDTAPFYGFGKTERYAGDAIRPRRDQVVLSTKAGRILAPQSGAYKRQHSWVDPLPFVDVYDYSYSGIMRSFEDSLQRLGLNRIDILLVHDIGTMTHGEANAGHWNALEEGGYRALDELRAAGTASAIGLGVNEWEVLMDAFEVGDWDVFLLAGRYTLLEQTALAPLLETCAKKHASVICGGPSNSGVLVGGSTWNYAEAPEEIARKVKTIEAACAD
ncbi:MAG TPA: aldo/keto reductase, partial [Devosiaceae bacterium]|nr:aldo/keto reductase [Devosiaceae bacterium]